MGLAPRGAVEARRATGSPDGREVGAPEEGGPLVLFELAGVGLKLHAAAPLALPRGADAVEGVVAPVGLEALRLVVAPDTAADLAARLLHLVNAQAVPRLRVHELGVHAAAPAPHLRKLRPGFLGRRLRLLRLPTGGARGCQARRGRWRHLLLHCRDVVRVEGRGTQEDLELALGARVLHAPPPPLADVALERPLQAVRL
mmetsp:Transcript_71229/g.196648  ORF Transcript_71229/g.196648 Transcript_71229/m.196648 type:complete len:200 (-) Transcript_71229:189-788(-)